MRKTAPETSIAHTSGPWEIREVAHEATPLNKRRVYRVEIIAPQYFNGRRTHARDIAQILDFADWTDQPANARLIAAAPDILAALRSALPVIERFVLLDLQAEAIVDGVRAAIAKAEGR